MLDLLLACLIAASFLSFLLGLFGWLQVFVKQGVFDALGVPVFNTESVRCVLVEAHSFPVTVIPTNFLLNGLVLSSLLHLKSYVFDWIVAFSLVQIVSYIRMLRKSSVEELEHVRSEAFEVSFTWIFLIHFDILKHDVVHVVYLTWIE